MTNDIEQPTSEDAQTALSAIEKVETGENDAESVLITHGDVIRVALKRRPAVDVESLRKGIKIITEAYEHLSQDGTYCEATIEVDFNNCQDEMRAVRDFIANGYLTTPDTIQVKREDVPKMLKECLQELRHFVSCDKHENIKEVVLNEDGVYLLSVLIKAAALLVEKKQ